MQALRPEDYARLRELATAWTRNRQAAARHEPGFNPRLAADALCFQYHDDGLLGALVTPLSLSLVLVPATPEIPPPEAGASLGLALPSGRYGMRLERLDDACWYWCCELLDDVSDIESRQRASRLAQRLMERVMSPAPDDD